MCTNTNLLQCAWVPLFNFFPPFLSTADQEMPQRDLVLEETPMELGGEQGRWEEERLKTASLSFGAKREREQGMRQEQEKYQLILEEDEMIDFVSTAMTMKGTRTEKVWGSLGTFYFFVINNCV